MGVAANPTWEIGVNEISKGDSSTHRSLRTILFGAAFALLVGLLAVLLPALFLPMKAYESPVFPLVRTAIEGMTPFTYVGLALGGLVLGWVFPYAAAFGLLTMAPFYLSAVIEMLVDPQSHKLWPIEFVIYLALSLLAVFGGLCGRWARRLLAYLRE